MPYNISNKLPTYTPPAGLTNFFGGSSPATTALNNKSQTQTWQQQLADVSNFDKTLPKIQNNQTYTQGQQISTPLKAPIKKEVKKDSIGNVTETHYYDTSNSTRTDNNGQGITPEQKAIADANAQKQTSSNTNQDTTKTPEQIPTTFPGLVGGTSNLAQGNIPIGQTAQDITNKYTGLINPILKNATGQEIGYQTGMGTNPVGVGNAAVVQNAAGQLIQGLTNQEQQELSGNTQRLTAQNQATTGMGNVAGLVSPIQVPYSNQVINPLTGQSVGGGIGNAQTDITNLATQLASGTSGMSYDQALSQLSGYGVAIQNKLLPEILKLNPSFNINASNAQATAQGNLTPLKIAETAAKGIASSIKQHLAENPQLNPSDLTFANSISQWASGQQLGDPKYQTLANYLNEYISTLAPILGVGGDTTNLKTEIAQSFVNAQASGQSISQVLDSIGKLASDKIANISSASQGGGQVAGGGSTGTSSGGTVKIGNSSFTQDANGNWIVAK